MSRQSHNRAFNCHLCNTSFPTVGEWATHMRENHSSTASDIMVPSSSYRPGHGGGGAYIPPPSSSVSSSTKGPGSTITRRKKDTKKPLSSGMMMSYIITDDRGDITKFRCKRCGKEFPLIYNCLKHVNRTCYSNNKQGGGAKQPVSKKNKSSSGIVGTTGTLQPITTIPGISTVQTGREGAVIHSPITSPPPQKYGCSACEFQSHDRGEVQEHYNRQHSL